MTPEYRITQDGNDITALIAERLISLSVTDNISWGTDALNIVLADPDGDLDIPRKGARLTCYLGYEGEALALMGVFVVDKVSVAGPPDAVTIACAGAAFLDADSGLAWQTKKSRSWQTQELGKLCGVIAADHDVELTISDVASLIVLPQIDQTDESDIHLLLRLGIDYNLVVKPAVGKLIIMQRTDSTTPGGTAISATTILPTDVRSWSFDLGNRLRYDKVITTYHDVATGQPVEKTAGTGSVVYRSGNAFANELDAQAAANSILASYQRGGVTFSFEMPGRTDLFADGELTLDGFRPSLNGAGYRIETAEHKIDNGGYSLTISGTNRLADGAEPEPDAGFEGISSDDGEGVTDEDGREPVTT